VPTSPHTNTPQLSLTLAAQFCSVQKSGRGRYSRRAHAGVLYVAKCRICTLHVLIQEHRERRGKEITKLLRRQWENGGKDKEIAAAKQEIEEAQKREREDKTVAAATHVNVRDANQQICTSSAMMCHQGPAA